MKPSCCLFYALLQVFLLLSLAFDLLNVCYSATHSSKFQPTDTFHFQRKPSCCHLYALLHFFFFFFFVWPIECLFFCHSLFQVSTSRYFLYPNDFSMLYCIFFYFFLIVLARWVFVILPLVLRVSTDWYFLYPNESLMLPFICLVHTFVFLSLCFDQVNVCYSATHSSKFQSADFFHIQMKPSCCHFYALLYIFLLLSLCFDMLNNFYSAAHSWKFRPADSFHNQMKPSCCHLYASCILLYFFPLFWPVEYLLFCHSFSKFQLADTFLIQMKHSYCNFYASLLSFVFLSLFWPVECLFFCNSLFQVSTGRRFQRNFENYCSDHWKWGGTLYSVVF